MREAAGAVVGGVVWRGVEARSDLRKPFQAQVRLSGIGGEPVTYLSQDLGRGGLFLRAARPLRKGTRVGVSFALPGGGRVTCLAEVAWSTALGSQGKSGMGLRFTPDAPEHLAPLLRYLDEDAERRRVLVLEDNPALRQLLLTSFEKQGALATGFSWGHADHALAAPHGLLVLGVDKPGLTRTVVPRRPVPRRVALLGYPGAAIEWHPHTLFCFRKPADPEQVARISLALFR